MISFLHKNIKAMLIISSYIYLSSLKNAFLHSSMTTRTSIILKINEIISSKDDTPSPIVVAEMMSDDGVAVDSVVIVSVALLILVLVLRVELLLLVLLTLTTNVAISLSM